MLWTGIKSIMNIKYNKFYDILILPKMAKLLTILKTLQGFLISTLQILLPKLIAKFLKQENLLLMT